MASRSATGASHSERPICLWGVPDANITDGMGMFTAGTTARIGATTDAAGQWEGQLHGKRSSDADPIGVLGRFDVSNDVVTIGGSFGARHTGE